MPNNDLYELKATPGPESHASCGCTFMFAVRKMIDARTGRWITSHDLVVVPCSEAHIELLHEVADPVEGQIADTRLLGDLAFEMSRRLAA